MNLGSGGFLQSRLNKAIALRVSFDIVFIDCLAHRSTDSALDFETIWFERHTGIVCWCNLRLCQNSWCIVSCFELSCIWDSLVRSESSLFRLLVLNLLIWSLWLLLVWKNHLAWMRRDMAVSIAWFASVLSCNWGLLLSWLCETSFGQLILLKLVHSILYLSERHAGNRWKIYIPLSFLSLLDLLFPCLVRGAQCLRWRSNHTLVLIPVLDCPTLSSIVESISPCMRASCDSFLILLRYRCFIEDNLLATE